MTTRSKKHAEIPRYEMLRLGFDHTSAQMVTLRALATTVCRRSTHRVHLSYSCLFSFADHLHLLNVSNMTELCRMAAACYRNRTVHLLVRTKIFDHRVRFFDHYRSRFRSFLLL